MKHAILFAGLIGLALPAMAQIDDGTFEREEAMAYAATAKATTPPLKPLYKKPVQAKKVKPMKSVARVAPKKRMKIAFVEEAKRKPTPATNEPIVVRGNSETTRVAQVSNPAATSTVRYETPREIAPVKYQSLIHRTQPAGSLGVKLEPQYSSMYMERPSTSAQKSQTTNILGAKIGAEYGLMDWLSFGVATEYSNKDTNAAMRAENSASYSENNSGLRGAQLSARSHHRISRQFGAFAGISGNLGFEEAYRDEEISNQSTTVTGNFPYRNSIKPEAGLEFRPGSRWILGVNTSYENYFESTEYTESKLKGGGVLDSHTTTYSGGDETSLGAFGEYRFSLSTRIGAGATSIWTSDLVSENKGSLNKNTRNGYQVYELNLYGGFGSDGFEVLPSVRGVLSTEEARKSLNSEYLEMYQLGLGARVNI